MEVFEVHITGDKDILNVDLKIKTISVELLSPYKEVIRTEYMTSIVMKCVNVEEAKNRVGNLVLSLHASGITIVRVKIECPFYKHYVDQSLYMESHFVSDEFKLPTSRNVKKSTFLATDRTYNKSDYEEFAEKYKEAEVELCVYDTDVEEDKDWMKIYQ